MPPLGTDRRDGWEPARRVGPAQDDRRRRVRTRARSAPQQEEIHEPDCGAEVSKSYATEAVEVQALRGVSFDVEAGAFLAFVGPSGSGKTTLLNLIGCLDKPTGGSLEVAGVDVTRLNRRQAAAFRGNISGLSFKASTLFRC